jgi:exodeoxyribonuclease V beta subunit
VKARAKFDIVDSALASDLTLIEASAGTGKTYTICGLVLRLILEKQLAIEEILVTTYTELATAELRDRIRNLLFQALTAFQTGKAEDELIEPLLEQYQSDQHAQRRLSIALQSFDGASIYTIHGFAQRMLRDRAFESGALFDAELITDQSDILHEITDDFWRRHFYAGEQIVTTLAIKNGLTPEKFFRYLTELTRNPTLSVIPPADGDIEIIKAECGTIWNQLRDCWNRCEMQIRAIFVKNAWAKYTHGNPAKMDVLLTKLSECLSDAAGALDHLDCIEKFAFSTIKKSVRVGYHAPSHDLFTLCDSLLNIEKKLCLSLQTEFFTWSRQEMKRRKVKRNVLSFDDLLTRVDEALSGEGGGALSQSIRERFKAALVDEFQDTDPIQYSIFQKIYGGKKMPVFFVGDPKQAIYGFRGADVFTYIAAAAAAPKQFTLGKNWRSTTELVRAVNTLFQLNPHPFILDGIPFEPVKAVGECDSEPLTVNGVREPPFKLWLAIEGEPIKKEDADRLLPRAVAAEIARLLNGNANIGERKVQPWDIAILVSKNEEARIMQEALKGLNIPSVLYGAANVFQSPEARELEYILAAVSEPGNERLIRAALTTDILGITGNDLDAMVLNDQAWDAKLVQFQKYHQVWNEKGFIQMLRTLLLEQGVRARLLSYPAGERRLTNLLHLSELLHAMCVEHRLEMTGTLKRLAEQRQNPDTTRSEQYEQRLESDEEAVRIVTVHKSKGLEYAIVFCPYSWSDADPYAGQSVIFHEDGKLTLDLERSDEHRQAQRRELLAEKLRLLYVALTRAKHRCYLVWGDFKFGRKSALAYLFGVPKAPDPLKELESPSQAVKSARSREEVDLSPGGETAFDVTKLPDASAESYKPAPLEPIELRPRLFDRAIVRNSGITSFTGLIRGHDIAPESPDYDSIETPQGDETEAEIEAPLTGIFAFPHGTRPGTCLHQILEELDFCNLDNMPEIVSRNLRTFSIGNFDDIVCEMIRKTVSVPLEIGRSDFTLSRIAAAARLQELEFYFPISSVTPAKLTQAFAEHREYFAGAIPSTIDRLQFRPMSGFMKGFIDLLFEFEGKIYLLDWKSNWLGPNLDAYASASIGAEMTRRFYTLQLSIYTVAVHRFLQFRKPGYDYEEHFGGAYYLFLRGIEPGRPELGIHRMKLQVDFVDKLSTLFMS